MRYFPLSARSMVLCAAGVLAAPGVTHAANLSLTDQNASFVVNTTGNGVLSMTVDGINHIWEQDFLHDVTHAPVAGKGKDSGTYTTQEVTRYEIGMADSGDGSPWLQNPVISQPASNLLTLSYTHTDVAIDISFELIGGALGSNAATIVESYTITNTNPNGPITVNLFAFTDVDLGGSFFSSQDDQGELLGSAPYNQYRQYDDNYQLIATTNIAPDYYMVGRGEGPNGETSCPDYYQIKCMLYDQTNTYLPNTILAGPADLQMAAQWVRTLGTGESFTYIHTMELCPASGCPGEVSEVPVPAALWLLGSGLLGLVGVARRRRAA